MTPEAIQGTAALLVRLALRYGAIPFALWIGLPAEVVQEITQDAELNAILILGVSAAIAAAVEAWTVWVRRHGGKT